MINRFLNFRFIPALLIGGAVIILGSFYFSTHGKQEAKSESQLREYAAEVFKKCSEAKYKIPCFDEEIPKLVGIMTMEEAFQVTRFIQEKEPAYLYCHVLGHNIAERETRKDPSKWMDVVARCPTTMCNNGCPHGALMERFKENINDYLTDEQIGEIKADLKAVCEPREDWNPREIERSMCYHALGHLHLYITNGDLRKSAELCRDVGIKNDGRSYVQTCTEGVFMTIYQPLGPEDIALVRNITPSKEKMPEFCAKFKENEMSFHACHKEAWAIFRNEIFNPDGYYKFCNYTDDQGWRDSCFRSVINPIADQKIVAENDIEWLKKFCGDLPEDVQGTCLYAAVHRLMQIDSKLYEKALEVCRTAADLGKKAQASCYDSLLYFGKLGFIPGSQELSLYCSKLPGAWRDQCLAGNWDPVIIE